MRNVWALIILFAFAVLVDKLMRRRRLLSSLPPSPKRLPLLGNWLEIPSRTPWKTYAAWGKQLNSDLISVWDGGQLMIVVNSAGAARELFDMRANYRDKPMTPMTELEGWTTWFASRMPYGEKWRARRRLLHQALNVKVVTDYIPMQEAQIRVLLDDLHADPTRFLRHIKHLTASISMMVAYGHKIAPEDDWAVQLAQDSVDRLANTLFPGAIVVNTFPSLKILPDWMPGTGFKAYARECVNMTTRLREEPFNMVKRMMARGEATPSMTRTLLQADPSPSALYERLVSDTACVTYVAGAEATSAAIEMSAIALVLHPNVQQRAQTEIDAVTGRTRLPHHSDMSSMPYTRAVMYEVLRWINIHPLGVYRRTMADDVYDGYFIPAGTTITWNTWAICHDPKVYADPDVFWPERFLTKDGQLAAEGERAVFGYGRRECPGVHFAKNIIWLALVSTLAVFDYKKAKDSDGNLIVVVPDCTDSAPSHPKPFVCAITPRDKKAIELLDTLKTSDI